MVVFTSKNIYVESDTRRHGKRVKYVGNHFSGKIPDLLSSKPKVGHTIWSGADVDDSSRKCLTDDLEFLHDLEEKFELTNFVQRCKPRSVASDTAYFSQCL